MSILSQNQTFVSSVEGAATSNIALVRISPDKPFYAYPLFWTPFVAVRGCGVMARSCLSLANVRA